MLGPLPPFPSDDVHPAMLREPEDNMTLCIAALARDDDNSFCIVTCSDKLESNDLWGSETLHKVQSLSPDLLSLFADSPARAKELQLLYEEYLLAHPLQSSNVVQQLEHPLIMLKRRLAESYVGRRLGISYAELLQDKDKWTDYIEKIGRHSLKVSLIIAGFLGTRPILLQTMQVNEHDELPRLEWVQHFAGIGSGYWTAEPLLRMRQQDQNTSLSKSLYHLYEAKRQAEISPAVGKIVTRMLVIRPRGNAAHLNAQVVTDDGIEELQTLYEQHGPKSVPRLPALKASSFLEARFSDPEGR